MELLPSLSNSSGILYRQSQDCQSPPPPPPPPPWWSSLRQPTNYIPHIAHVKQRRAGETHACSRTTEAYYKKWLFEWEERESKGFPGNAGESGLPKAIPPLWWSEKLPARSTGMKVFLPAVAATNSTSLSKLVRLMRLCWGWCTKAASSSSLPNMEREMDKGLSLPLRAAAASICHPKCSGLVKTQCTARASMMGRITRIPSPTLVQRSIVRKARKASNSNTQWVGLESTDMPRNSTWSGRRNNKEARSP